MLTILRSLRCTCKVVTTSFRSRPSAAKTSTTCSISRWLFDPWFHNYQRRIDRNISSYSYHCVLLMIIRCLFFAFVAISGQLRHKTEATSGSDATFKVASRPTIGMDVVALLKAATDMVEVRAHQTQHPVPASHNQQTHQTLVFGDHPLGTGTDTGTHLLGASNANCHAGNGPGCNNEGPAGDTGTGTFSPIIIPIIF